MRYRWLQPRAASASVADRLASRGQPTAPTPPVDRNDAAGEAIRERHDRLVRAQQRRRQPDDGVHRRQRPPRRDEHPGRGVSGDGARPHPGRGPVPGRRPRGGRGGGERPHRGGDPGHRRHQAHPVDGVRGDGLGDDRARPRRRRAPGGRRGQEQRRRHHHVPDPDREADHPRADEPAAGGRHRGLRRHRPVHPEAGHRAGARRADRHPGDHAGRHRERAALRDLDRGLRGRPAAARPDVRPGGGRRAPVVPGPAGRVGADGAGRDPAADDRAGLPRGGVRGPGALDAGRRQPPAPRRRGDGGRRLRGDGPVRAVRRRAGDDGLRLPHRRPERGRPRRAGHRVRRGSAGAPPGGRLAHGLAERRRVAEQPARADAADRLRGLRARVPGAGAVPGAAPGVLGQPRHPDLVPGGDRPAAGPRRLLQHAVAVRVRPRAGHRRRRRHHRGREHLPAPGGARRRPARRHRGRPRDRPAGHLRGPDDGGRLQPAAVRGRHDGQGAAGHSARRDPVPAVLAAGVAEHPPGAPRAHPAARSAGGRGAASSPGSRTA